MRTRVDTCTRGLQVRMQSVLEPSASAADEGTAFITDCSRDKRCDETPASVELPCPAARGRDDTSHQRLKNRS